MTAFFTWYIILTLLGWLTFPLVYTAFPRIGRSRLHPRARRGLVDLGICLLAARFPRCGTK